MKPNSITTRFSLTDDSLISINVRVGSERYHVLHQEKIDCGEMSKLLSKLTDCLCAVYPLRNPKQAVVLVGGATRIYVLQDILDLTSPNLNSSILFKMLQVIASEIS